MTHPRIIGSAIEAPRSLSGVGAAIDMSGGGFVAVDYLDIQLGNNQAQGRLRYYASLQKLNGGVRQIIVPLLTDALLPLALGTPIYTLTTLSDGSSLSDGSLISQPAVSGQMVGAAALNASTVTMDVWAPLPLQGGEWFGLSHATKGFRAYQITDIDSTGTGTGDATRYTIGIRPPLRDSIADASIVDFVRPRCTMRLAPGTEVKTDLEHYFYATPELHFVEAF